MTAPQSFIEEWNRLRAAAEKAPRGYRRAARARLAAYAHSLLASDVGVQQTLMWVPIGSFVPPGWHLARQELGQYSHNFSQLVERDA